ncbi:DUF349 domain-containing protein [Pseudoalteromonas mariniglutinosa]|uniref:DUF349 domain-containing protein n=1 Tax=Pseudoalteromonas mariniglutinosa TaxID=206042 RepID=UPI00384D82A2
MIFKHLFTPKWKHPKSQVRLEAIERLDIERDAAILNSLALEDSSAEIRKKALHKVNDIVLWWQAYKQDQALKEVAEQYLNHAVLDTESQLDARIKSEYIERFAPLKTLEKLAFAEKEIQVRVKLLKRLANPVLIDKAFREGSEDLQEQLVGLVISHQLIKPLLKHAKGDAKSRLQTHLEDQRLAAEMPAKVEAETRIVLAKLNALRDKSDFTLVEQQHLELLSQWQTIELKWLSNEQVELLDEKYTRITEKLTSHLDTLRQQHLLVQQELIEQQRQVLAVATLQALAEEIDNALQLGVETPEQIQQDWLDAKVAQAKAALVDTELSDSKEVREVRQQLTHLFHQVEQLPQIIQAINEFRQALASLANIESSSEESRYDALLSEFNHCFKNAKNTLTKIPSRLQSRFKSQLNECSTKWHAEMATLTQKFEKNQQQAKRKARDVKRLIEQGRFNVAFGVFKGFEELYSTLTDAYQLPLINLKSDLQSQLADAKDWQKYAAAPKREEILSEVKQLLAVDCADAKQRAEHVKQLRRRWNELGRLDTEQEKQQGAEFDQQIELLFAPCRRYFAEQEQLRDKAKEERQAIIAQMHLLAEYNTDSDECDWKLYESKYNRINKAWRLAGNVEPKLYRSMQTTYKQYQQAVLDNLHAFHKMNAQLKSELVEQAEQLSQSDDLAVACQQLKGLQQQWQMIGFAGIKAENALWQQFRRFNDDTFAKRSNEFDQHKQQQQQSEEVALTQIEELEQALDEIQQQSQLNDLQTKLLAIEHSKALNSRVERLNDAIKLKHTVLVKQAQRFQMQTLFAALQSGDEIPSQFNAPLNTQLSSLQLLTRMEILAGVESADSQLRISEQVAMLDDKHRGEHADIHHYLKQLLVLSKGSVDADTLSQLKAIFS